MQKIGDIRRGKLIGKDRGKRLGHWYTWHACVDCGKTRWVRLVKDNKPKDLRCHSCANKFANTVNRLIPYQFKSGKEHPLFGKHQSEKHRIKMAEFSGENNPAWKGGIGIYHGYVKILQPDHHRTNGEGYVKRCYLVWEKMYGSLPKEFEIHHTDSNKSDDRITNLSAMIHSYHGHVERVLKDLGFVVVPGIYPPIDKTWEYINSLKEEGK